jgi:hypothetical protein
LIGQGTNVSAAGAGEDQFGGGGTAAAFFLGHAFVSSVLPGVSPGKDNPGEFLILPNDKILSLTVFVKSRTQRCPYECAATKDRLGYGLTA